MEIQRTVNTDLDVSSEIQVLTYTYPVGKDPLEVITRVDIGSEDQPIVGGNVYTVNFYINNVLVTPITNNNVPLGITKTIVISRAIPIDAGDIVKITVIGQPADNDVTVIASLRTATPLQESDIYGNGEIMVDHNYGGLDNYAYLTSGSIGIDNATILVFLKTDYDAGNRTDDYIKGRTLTTVNGRWKNPIMLDPDTYTVVAFKQGEYGPDTKTLVVTS